MQDQHRGRAIICAAFFIAFTTPAYYFVTMVTDSLPPRTQTGLRISTPLLKVLKGLAEYKDMTLGDLVEGIVLHAFDNKLPFTPDTLETIARLGEIYGLDQTSDDSHMQPDGIAND